MNKTICLIALMLICLIIPSIIKADVSAEKVFIAPSEKISPGVGKKFVIEVSVDGAKGLSAFEFALSYNPDLLKFVGATEGDFLKATGPTFVTPSLVYREKPKDGGLGTVKMGAGKLSGSGVDGNGILAQLEFEVIKELRKSILLEFKEVNLYDNHAKKKTPDKIIGGMIIPSENCLGDLNGDGDVDIADIVFVAIHFGQSPPADPKADVNGDGKIDLADIAFVANHFGEECETTSPAP